MPQRIDIVDFLVRTLGDPRGAFRDLLALDLPRGALWELLLLLVALRVLAMGLFGQAFVLPFGMAPVSVLPLTYATTIVSSFVVMVFLIHYTGRAMGGTGTFQGALVATVLIEVLSLMLVLAQLLVSVLSTALAGIVGLAAIPVLLLCTLTYIDTLHGFGSLWKAFGMVLLAVLGLSLGLSLLLALIGVGVPR